MENKQQQQLPTELFWGSHHEIFQIEGFWYHARHKESIAAFRSEFEPRNDDILLTSFIKTGTTWLKALSYNILDEEENDVLAKKNPHDVVPTIEIAFLQDQVQHMLLNSPPGRSRLLHTHLPCSYLPEKVRSSPRGCKLVHVARNPKDTLVSMWHFYNKNVKVYPDGPFPLERAVEIFCNGAVPWGPFYEHVVEYWEESRRRPEEVLFLKYEDLCRNPEEQLRKLATFLGRKTDFDVEKVLWRSSLNRLKDLEVNKNGARKDAPYIPNSILFRTGTVGDWKNYLTSDMARRVDSLTRIKLQGTGLSFDDE
ncbi:unnamed protein product [Linum tenue]|uniref:Sulfotransferase n=1 Tax=Linum tenue TaxID=586396 RepID=A0AAV0LTC4_9ROSI|nr:unnamed protein product [Linum tenue]